MSNNLATDYEKWDKEKQRQRVENDTVKDTEITGTRDAPIYEESLTPDDGPVRVRKLNAE